MLDILKLFGLSGHYGISSQQSFIDPNPDQAAKFCWNLLAKNLWSVHGYPYEFPKEELKELHKALDSIEGSLLIPRNDECDACDFAAALSTMAQFGYITPIYANGPHYFDADLCGVFEEWQNISEESLIAEMLPKKREHAKRYLPRAAERIKWLAAIKEQRSITDPPYSGGLKQSRKPGPGAPPNYTDEEKEEILQQYKTAQAEGEKRDAFIERLAREQEKPSDEVRKLLEAAARGDRRKRPK